MKWSTATLVPEKQDVPEFLEREDLHCYRSSNIDRPRQELANDVAFSAVITPAFAPV